MRSLFLRFASRFRFSEMDPRRPLEAPVSMRAVQKQASREADARAIARGEKSAAQMNRENGLAFGVVEQFRKSRGRGVPGI